jgi:hypothetical protein
MDIEVEWWLMDNTLADSQTDWLCQLTDRAVVCQLIDT